MKLLKLVHDSLLLPNLKDEQWKGIPETDGLFLISNYGRVKRLERYYMRGTTECLLPLKMMKASIQVAKRKNKNIFGLRVQVKLTIDNKYLCPSIARLVYHLFVKPFDYHNFKVVVSFKDENPLNLFYKNLIITNRSATCTKAFKNKRRPRDSFGNIADTISQYDFNGVKIATYDSLNDIHTKTGIEPGYISTTMKHGDGFAAGFIWRKGKPLEKIKKIKKTTQKKIKRIEQFKETISQYNENGEKIATYSNIREAAKKNNLDASTIKRVCDGKLLSTSNYIWQYGDGAKQLKKSVIQIAKEKRIQTIATPVTQYNLEGERLAYFKTQAEASRQTGLTSYSIYEGVSNGENTTAGGYIWRYGKGKKKINLSKELVRKAYLQKLYLSEVSQYDDTGKRIAIFSNLKLAAESVKSQLHAIVAAIEGKAIRVKGFYWVKGKSASRIDVPHYETLIADGILRKSRVIAQYNLDGKFIKKFSSLKAAQDETGISFSYISDDARGKHKTPKGFIWKYIN
jgi:hypothetical protein